MKKFSLIIALALVVACNSNVYVLEEEDDENLEVIILREYEPVVTISYEDDIDPDTLLVSLEQWEVMLEYTIFEFARENEIANIHLTTAERIPCGRGNANYLGCASGNIYQHDQCNIKIRDDVKDVSTVYVHEIGHCLGIPHDISYYEQSIMTPTIGANKTITEHHIMLVNELLTIRAEEYSQED